MTVSKLKKNKTMQEIRELLKSNRNIALTEYRGINVEQMTALRASMRKVGMRFKVIKNTLSKKLFQEAGIRDLDQYLQGPVAISFLSTDVTQSTKTLLNLAKQNELFVVKAGYVDGKIVSLAGIKAIAALPSREVLLAMLLGNLQAPLKQFMSVAQGPIRQLVYTLQAWKEKKAKAAA